MEIRELLIEAIKTAKSDQKAMLEVIVDLREKRTPHHLKAATKDFISKLYEGVKAKELVIEDMEELSSKAEIGVDEVTEQMELLSLINEECTKARIKYYAFVDEGRII